MKKFRFIISFAHLLLGVLAFGVFLIAAATFMKSYNSLTREEATNNGGGILDLLKKGNENYQKIQPFLSR